MMRNSFCMLFLFLFFISAHSQKPSSHKIVNSSALSSESYQSMTFNGSWCWFSDPRAVYFEGEYKRTYSGWVDNYGDIHIAFYDHETNEIASRVIYDGLEVDDHNNPSILFDEEGHLLVFFNTHMMGEMPLFLVKSTLPESIEAWGEVKELFLNDASLKNKGRLNHTYTNPVKLSSEKGRIYLFWRGVDGKPSYSFSEDNGDSWSTGKVFFMPEPIYSFRRPYAKIYSDGNKRIHFTFTDGHPRKEKENSIYYMYYEGGSFFRADGSRIKEMGIEPVSPAELDKVYDGKSGKAKAWNWDIAQDPEGNPVIAYVRFPDDEKHMYCYASYQNGKWNNYELINSGRWFPETPDGFTEPEPNYSGGMSIDKENPSVIYLSVNRDSIFEIEKWTSSSQGKKWKVEKITSGSAKNNIRPFAVRNAGEGNPLQLLWMQNTRYHHFAYHNRLKSYGKTFRDRFHSSIKMDIPSPEITNALSKEGILRIMRQTADWQLANPFYGRTELDWHYGAFLTGLRAFSEIVNEERYINEMYNIGQAAGWKPLDDIFHADRLTIIDNWAWLYEIYELPEIIDKSGWLLDIHLARRYRQATDVRFEENPYRFEWWTWCDALFMAPPSFVEMWKITGIEEYLKYMDTQWWKTSDYLYSPEDSLYYRDDRFFAKLSENGKKIFWSRGNGWVIAGIARILEDLPGDYPNREEFEKQYLEMAHKFIQIQDEDGLWRVSLHDPEYLDMGESSGSSFFTFALAWGINNGLLGKEYIPAVEKAWLALCNNVNGEGRLGFVQQVAGDPYPFYEDQWQVYATGAFLLAGKEMYLMNSAE